RKMNEKHEYLMLNHATNRGYCGGTTTNLCLKRSSRTVSPANLKQPTKEIDNFITVNCEW
ncbi:hypothetical protein, partial [Bacteroides caecimuris]|uniref:hypothetical protein n=1 Tax=Bacteroides caecimuris TaxID=1796613 RepID=UPI0025B7A31B